MNKALIEALKEPLRLVVLAVLPFAVAYFGGLPYVWAGSAVVVLRTIDKYLHETGKEKENEQLIKGLTRF